MLDHANESERELVQHVRPSGWRNPVPASMYDIVVLGGGTAGLVGAMGAAGLGARVALVEGRRLGGDCLNDGCVPSKALIRSARAVAEVRRGTALGVRTSGMHVDFTTVMARLRARRVSIAANDSTARLQAAGVDVFFGHGTFADRRTLTVDGLRLRFTRALIATGARPIAPPIAGLDSIPYLTNETVFDLMELPRRFLIIGGGPIGCELAQAYARLGSTTTIVDQGRQLLGKEDPAAAAVVRRALEHDGVQCELGARIEAAGRRGNDLWVRVTRDGSDKTAAPFEVLADAVLVAAGRIPNVDGLALDAAGVETDRDGIVVNDRLQTSNRRIFASGDVCSRYKFTHAADAMSRLVVQNALFFGRRKVTELVIPWVTYTDPEVAHVGVTSADVDRSAGRLHTITIDLSHVDRAIIDDDTAGFLLVHHERGKLRGCTIVASHAGEIIGEAVYALTHGGTLGQLSATIHPYPTHAEALRKAGDAYRRQALTAGVRRWLGRYFAWTR